MRIKDVLIKSLPIERCLWSCLTNYGELCFVSEQGSFGSSCEINRPLNSTRRKSDHLWSHLFDERY